MGFEPPVLDQHAAPVAPGAQRAAYTPSQEQDQRHLLRVVISLVIAVCGGLAAIFLFFAAMGAIDLRDAIAATVVAVVMGIVWFAGFYQRHRTGTTEQERRDRERRGF